MKKTIVQAILQLALLSSVFAQSENDPSTAVTGIWSVGSGRARIQIFKGKDHFIHGKIVWLKQPLLPDGKVKTDQNNPDPSKRNGSLIGLTNLRNFSYAGNGDWENGKIYDPERGTEYSCKMHLIRHEILEVRGYLGISLLGRSDTWTRVNE
jgi:uncharacterized protein (DUF2147 family)